ncbi:hypothetical protein D3C79_822040 [compost metagenome]
MRRGAFCSTSTCASAALDTLSMVCSAAGACLLPSRPSACPCAGSTPSAAAVCCPTPTIRTIAPSRTCSIRSATAIHWAGAGSKNAMRNTPGPWTRHSSAWRPRKSRRSTGRSPTCTSPTIRTATSAPPTWPSCPPPTATARQGLGWWAGPGRLAWPWPAPTTKPGRKNPGRGYPPTSTLPTGTLPPSTSKSPFCPRTFASNCSTLPRLHSATTANSAWNCPSTGPLC